ncbi:MULTISPECIES: hypothetical protein [unclassified Mesorhizobium]|uniref:hypothetical protein n=1 Tax=unclassified Mesorhizobium TaxID=325217 RepID=UPI0013E04B37|nr:MULTISPECIES: hypothetical protein [unclassified Mesorhizobium]
MTWPIPIVATWLVYEWLMMRRDYRDFDDVDDAEHAFWAVVATWVMFGACHLIWRYFG